MVSVAGVARRVAYGALFVVVLPVALVLWAGASAAAVPFAPIHEPALGMALALSGVLLMAGAARELIMRGGGLPMNAFPPPRFVRSGVYRYLDNPMYIGFGLACAGVSLATGSASGLWLVTPVTCLAAAALVYGYERHDLRRRFGAAVSVPPLLALPPDGAPPPNVWQRVAVLGWVLVPWLVAYSAVQALGRPADAFQTALPIERRWPVLEWTELLYASTYLFVPITVVVARTQRSLRRYAIEGLIATVVVTLIWLAVPVVAANRPVEPVTVLGRALAWEQRHSNGVAAFPAFHVLWALIAAECWSASAGGLSLGRRRIGRAWAAGIVVSSVTTGNHTLLEVAAAIVVYGAVRHYQQIWERARQLSERVANSWTEWRLGPIRVISHGAWAGAAAGVGVLVAGSAAGPGLVGAIAWVGSCILLGAGLWAQVLEGSSKLLRPFGWYGGVLGGVAGALAARIAGVPIAPLLAAFSVAAPWIQILGRLRCLVQGCCHGAPAPVSVGIRYTHPRSRVSQLSNLAAVPIHATPLYSIAGNLVLGVVLARLRVLGAPHAIVIGTFLMLGGIARFVEESFRGEPQTPVIAGLRSYQWIAILTVVAGIICTTLSPAPVSPGFAAPAERLVLLAIVMALVTGVAMGVDFPASNRRFSRLAAGEPMDGPS